MTNNANKQAPTSSPTTSTSTNITSTISSSTSKHITQTVSSIVSTSFIPTVSSIVSTSSNFTSNVTPNILLHSTPNMPSTAINIPAMPDFGTPGNVSSISMIPDMTPVVQSCLNEQSNSNIYKVVNGLPLLC
eukprot:539056_1